MLSTFHMPEDQFRNIKCKFHTHEQNKIRFSNFLKTNVNYLFLPNWEMKKTDDAAYNLTTLKWTELL